mgnify:CR=1 FL=1
MFCCLHCFYSCEQMNIFEPDSSVTVLNVTTMNNEGMKTLFNTVYCLNFKFLCLQQVQYIDRHMYFDIESRRLDRILLEKNSQISHFKYPNISYEHGTKQLHVQPLVALRHWGTEKHHDSLTRLLIHDYEIETAVKPQMRF